VINSHLERPAAVQTVQAQEIESGVYILPDGKTLNAVLNSRCETEIEKVFIKKG
jgi:hypothetical protein